MRAFELANPSLDAIGFHRLQALAERGYAPLLKVLGREGGHIGISFTHPRYDAKQKPAPKITLWSDGLIATNALLWPDRHVVSEAQTPNWQRFIMPDDDGCFVGFLESVAPPNIVDLYLRPSWLHARIFTLRLLFAATLCMLIAFGIRLVADLV